ncbi:MAG TPA: Smr/MutS family protein [Rhodothermales bacterium]|nr:Smr/MutS family protein [Rhodothermales bacterium]
MPYPTLKDDGHTVTLDLHGATVDEALDLTQQVIREAAQRGRSSVKIVHGTSTSDTAYGSHSIKHALYDLLDRQALDASVTSEWRADSHLLLSLDVSATRNPNLMRLLDFW